MGSSEKNPSTLALPHSTPQGESLKRGGETQHEGKTSPRKTEGVIVLTAASSSVPLRKTRPKGTNQEKISLNKRAMPVRSNQNSKTVGQDKRERPE